MTSMEVSEFEALRQHLMSVAYRLTGTVADAEDIVQEAWLRWDSQDTVIADPRAWLTTVVSRLGLDKLRSAAHRRETYTGTWLPEPVVTGLDATDPLAAVVAAEDARFAAMVVLERLRPLWGYATPPAIELAERLARYAPGDLNRVFFTSGGTEAVETAWKVAKQYFKLTGKPGKHKVISRSIAYHGTTQGALAITGLPLFKAPFEPLTPGGFRVPNTNFYRAPLHTDLKEFGRWAADRIAEAIEFEGPDTVAAVFLEPVQNAGGCIPAPPGYFERVREICDRYDVLLVSDEVICAFGRIGSMFACEDLGYVPDMITCAKGLTSGYSPLGAMIASDRLFEPFNDGETMFAHGYTFGGHPVSAAVGLANLDIFEREGLSDHVKRNSPALRATLEKLYDLPIVGDIRGEGYFFGIELVKDQATKQTFTDDERARLLGQVSAALFEAGLYCRTDDRGDPVVQVAPPLISGQPEFDTIETILRSVLTDTGRKYLHL